MSDQLAKRPVGEGWIPRREQQERRRGSTISCLGQRIKRKTKRVAAIIILCWGVGAIPAALMWQDFLFCSWPVSIHVGALWPLITIGRMTNNQDWFSWAMPWEKAATSRCYSPEVEGWLKNRRLQHLYRLDRV